MTTLLPAVVLLGPPRKTRARILAATVGTAAAWTGATTVLAEVATLPQMAAWILAPAVVTVLTIPEVRERWWRWPAVWLIFSITYYGYAPFVLGGGLAWIASDAFLRRHTVAVAADDLTADPRGVRVEPSHRNSERKTA